MMLNKMKIMLLVVLVIVIDTISMVSIISVAASRNDDILEAKEQIAVIEATDVKDIKHELVKDNLSFMLNGCSEETAKENGLTENEVVRLVKEDDNSYSDIAIVTFEEGKLIYNTVDTLNTSIECSMMNISTITMGCVMVATALIISVVAVIAELLDK